MSGMAMLLKQLGIDPEKITADFTALKEGVEKTLKEISGTLKRLEEKQDLNTKLLQELTAWKRIQTYQPQNQPALPQAVQQPLNPVPSEQSTQQP